MTILTVNINDKKAEKALKAFLDALNLQYKIEKTGTVSKTSSWNGFINSLDEFTSDFMEERNEPSEQKENHSIDNEIHS